jgi:hypothetical protein
MPAPSATILPREPAPCAGCRYENETEHTVACSRARREARQRLALLERQCRRVAEQIERADGLLCDSLYHQMKAAETDVRRAAALELLELARAEGQQAAGLLDGARMALARALGAHTCDGCGRYLCDCDGRSA